MKVIIGFLCCLVALLVLFSPLSSVVQYAASQSQQIAKESPLFSVRIARSLDHKSTQQIHTGYLGKGVPVDIFPTPRLLFQGQLEQAFRFISSNPSVLRQLVERLAKSPGITQLLSKYSLSISQLELFLLQVRKSPDLVITHLQNLNRSFLAGDSAVPLGLDTANFFQCVVTALVLLPIAIAIGFLIATAMIFTCLGVQGCFLDIVKAIYSQLLLDLRQP